VSRVEYLPIILEVELSYFSNIPLVDILIHFNFLITTASESTLAPLENAFENLSKYLALDLIFGASNDSASTRSLPLGSFFHSTPSSSLRSLAKFLAWGPRKERKVLFSDNQNGCPS
jgi:hypothetical protein